MSQRLSQPDPPRVLRRTDRSRSTRSQILNPWSTDSVRKGFTGSYQPTQLTCDLHLLQSVTPIPLVYLAEIWGWKSTLRESWDSSDRGVRVSSGGKEDKKHRFLVVSTLQTHLWKPLVLSSLFVGRLCECS